jgi:hypothetical protein
MVRAPGENSKVQSARCYTRAGKETPSLSRDIGAPKGLPYQGRRAIRASGPRGSGGSGREPTRAAGVCQAIEVYMRLAEWPSWPSMVNSTHQLRPIVFFTSSYYLLSPVSHVPYSFGIGLDSLTTSLSYTLTKRTGKGPEMVWTGWMC